MALAENSDFVAPTFPASIGDVSSGAENIIRLFEHQSRLHGYRTAILFESQRLDYTALNQYANRIAHALLELNINPDTAVGILGERSHHCVASFLGILKAGLSAVLIDQEYSWEDLETLMGGETQQPYYILTTRKHSPCPLLSNSDNKAHALFVDGDFGRRHLTTNPKLELAHKHAACRLAISKAEHYPSGNPTGSATGNEQCDLTSPINGAVEISHSALYSTLNACRQSWGIDSRCRTLFHCRASSNYTLVKTLLPLIAGGSVAIAKGGDSLAGQDLFNAIEKDDVNFLQIDSTLLKNSIEHLEEQSLLTPSCINTIVVSGTPVSSSIQQRGQEKTAHQLRWLQVYGSAETLLYNITFETTGFYRNHPIAHCKPLPGCEIHILNEQGTPVRQGEAGQLHIGGASLCSAVINGYITDSLINIDNPNKTTLFNTGLEAAQLLSGDFEVTGNYQRKLMINDYPLGQQLLDALSEILGSDGRVEAFPGIDKQELKLELLTNKGIEINEVVSHYLISEFPAPVRPQSYNLNGDIFNLVADNQTVSEQRDSDITEQVASNDADPVRAQDKVLPPGDWLPLLPQYKPPQKNIMEAGENPSENQMAYSLDELDFSFDGLDYSLFNQRCKENQCSAFEFIACSFALLLFRYSNSTFVELGIPEVGTKISGTAHYNPVSITVNPRDWFFTFLHNTVMEMRREDRSTPAPIPDPSQTVIIDHYSYQEKSVQAESPLQLFIDQGNPTIRGVIRFDTRAFEYVDIESMSSHLQQLVKSACEQPTSALTLLNLLPANEKTQLLESFNNTKTHYDTEHGIAELFTATAKANPDKIAVVMATSEISYQELNSRVDILTSFLFRQNIGRNSLVAVNLSRGIDLIVSLLAILKTGAAYLPIDPDYPADRISHILSDSGVKLMITQQGLYQEHPNSTIRQINIDSQWEQISALKTVLPETRHCPEDLCYSIYTSGSTGLPKGVRVNRRNALNFLLAMKTKPGIQSEDVLMGVTTIAFDISVLEIFLPLISGATLALATSDIARDGERLAQFIAATNSSIMQATPGTWQMLFESGWQGAERLKVLCGGEPLPSALAENLLQTCSELWNMYGPTETTVWSSCKQITEMNSPISIGKPIDNTEILILDGRGRLCPVNIPGELCIGGHGVSDGYHKLQALTDLNFVDHPFYPDENKRLYRTGDIAKWTHNGELLCLGRKDTQIKLRGYRIELGEIEAQLVKLPEIDQAVVQLASDPDNENQPDILVAYIIGNRQKTKNTYGPLALVGPSASSRKLQGKVRIGGTSLSTNADTVKNNIRSQLQNLLPHYMIPTVIIDMDHFPKTDNGKTDRSSLPDPFLKKSRSKNPKTAENKNKTASEQLVAQMWRDLVDADSINGDDNFFSIGGHSLGAMRFIRSAKERFNTQLSTRTLLTANLSQIARQFDKSRSDHIAAEKDGSTAPHLACTSSEYVENLFFRSDGYSLYGVCHHPVDQESKGAILICNPLGHEYTRSHRSLRMVADVLAQQGFFVFRFDYAGTGNSAGEFSDILPRQLESDIVNAVQQLSLISGYREIGCIALRSGALLLQSAIDKAGLEISRLVLWDPVFSGSKLLADQTTLTQKALNCLDRYRCKQPTDGASHVMGYTYGKLLYQHLETLALNENLVSARSALILQSRDEFIRCQRQENHFQSLMEKAESRQVDDDYGWLQTRQADSIILAFAAIKATDSWFGGTNTERLQTNG